MREASGCGRLVGAGGSGRLVGVKNREASGCGRLVVVPQFVNFNHFHFTKP